MRDINRIQPLLDEIKKYWEKRPDLRFAQVMAIMQDRLKTNDLFYYEDDVILKALKEMNSDEEVTAGI